MDNKNGEAKHVSKSLSKESSKNSAELLDEDMRRMAGDSEFPELTLEQRRFLIESWHTRDRERMRLACFKHFQFTNFVGEWRVGDGGSLSILPHGSIRRRRLREKEMAMLERVVPSKNPDFVDGSTDIENTNHLLSVTADEIRNSEFRFGGGSKFFLVPRIVLLARERLAGL